MNFNDNPLSRAGTQVSQEIIKPLRNILVGRHLASINPYVKGDGKTAVEMTKVADLSDAFIQWNLPTGNEFDDSIVAQREIVNIPVLYKKFSVQMADILAWNNREVGAGQENSLELVSANFASRKVAEQEETLIFDGFKPDGTNYQIKGFSQSANNSVTGGSISTAGTMFGYVGNAISAIEDDGIFGENGAYNLCITPTIKGALLTKTYSNGDMELDKIKAILNGGQIYTTPYLPSGTAIVTPVDTARNYFEFINPVDYNVVFSEPKFAGLSPVEGICHELFTINYKYKNGSGNTDAVCKITSLTA